MAGVDAHAPAQLGDLDLLGLRELEQDPGLRERVGRRQEARPEHAQLAGVEAVERAQLGDGIGHPPDTVGEIVAGVKYLRVAAAAEVRIAAAATAGSGRGPAKYRDHVGRLAERIRHDGSGLHAERGDRLGPDDCEQHGAGGGP